VRILEPMHDRDLYSTILGIRPPWFVDDVKVSASDEEVRVHLAIDTDAGLRCPLCDAASPRYDARHRSWRHLDTCQFRTILEADVPRVQCAEHGVHLVKVPWAEPGSRFTALFECLAIDWMKEASISAVARRLRVSWDQLEVIRFRAVRRGLARRKPETLRRIGVDETSFQKRHEYVTIVSDLDRPRVIHVGDDRDQSSLDYFFETLSEEERAAIEVVALDMWEPYIRSIREHVPDASKKICFDKFHVAMHLGNAVDKVRRQEHRELLGRGDSRLKGTKHLWLQNPDNMSEPRWKRLKAISRCSLRVARAWAVKETAMTLWDYSRRGWARRAWTTLVRWTRRFRMEPVRVVGRMIESHLEGILNAIVHNVTSALSESFNATIQWI